MPCALYEKHHNIIDGVFLVRKPITWDEIPYMDDFEAEDETGELFALFQDAKIYDIEDLPNFKNPTDIHDIKETIFIIRRNGQYYLCETQGENYVKFATNITNVDFVESYDRLNKLIKLQTRTIKS